MLQAAQSVNALFGLAHHARSDYDNACDGAPEDKGPVGPVPDAAQHIDDGHVVLPWPSQLFIANEGKKEVIPEPGCQ